MNKLSYKYGNINYRDLIKEKISVTKDEDIKLMLEELLEWQDNPFEHIKKICNSVSTGNGQDCRSCELCESCCLGFLRNNCCGDIFDLYSSYERMNSPQSWNTNKGVK